MFNNSKRKKEITKALKEGNTVLYFKKILNSPHYEKPMKVVKVWGETITTDDSEKHDFIDGDYFQIKSPE